MWLLNTTTHRLENHALGTKKYGILSHVWGDREVLYSDVARSDEEQSWKKEKHAAKVLSACALAHGDGHAYIWIDNCCIDKSSSSELSEAINSMYKWYSSASVCYAYLHDVDTQMRFYRIRWFTRGWTLQELIAPRKVRFYSKTWTFLGTRGHHAAMIRKVTQIPETLLVDRFTQMEEMAALQTLHTTSIARRMTWAKSRSTTRPEDHAYCLLGIFGVTMPLLHGEGASRAFLRLQEEIIRHSGDQSVLVHTEPCLLSSDPSHFRENVSVTYPSRKSDLSISPDGDVALDVLLVKCQKRGRSATQERYMLAVLRCSLDDCDRLGQLAFLIERAEGHLGRFRVVEKDHEMARTKLLLVLRNDGSLIWYASGRLYPSYFVPESEYAKASRARIMVKMYDNSIEARSSSVRIMAVRLAPSALQQHISMSIVSTMPHRDGDSLISASNILRDHDSRYVFNGNDTSEWMGVMLLKARDTKPGRLPRFHDRMFVLAWGLRHSFPLSMLDKDSERKVRPWCKLLAPAQLQHPVDAEANTKLEITNTAEPEDAHEPEDTTPRLEEEPLPFDVVHELKNLPCTPNLVLWHHYGSSSAERTAPAELSMEQREQQREHMSTVFDEMKRLCEGADAVSITGMGPLLELVAEIHRVTFLDRTTYELQLSIHEYTTVDSVAKAVIARLQENKKAWRHAAATLE